MGNDVYHQTAKYERNSIIKKLRTAFPHSINFCGSSEKWSFHPLRSFVTVLSIHLHNTLIMSTLEWFLKTIILEFVLFHVLLLNWCVFCLLGLFLNVFVERCNCWFSRVAFCLRIVSLIYFFIWHLGIYLAFLCKNHIPTTHVSITIYKPHWKGTKNKCSPFLVTIFCK